ncbi:nucleoside triphosphate pyrophosphohydrolase family protein [Treponema pectinovorum]|uniref:hypothetical protein n=1 Tax=Treponema pectinovorum TaxID=164 RepID=UPI0011C7AAD7|nr:hypothetical protein [Treponema pectinovorum]
MTEKEKLYEIFIKIGRNAVLEQVLEECGELVQASAKQLRIFRGKNCTPVKLSENSENLLEEAADVSLCIELLAVSFYADTEKAKEIITKIKTAKLKRWLERLEIKAE